MVIQEKRLLMGLLALFLLLGSLYAVTTPVFEASDELWHYPMIQHLGNGNHLPVQVFDPAQAGPWKQEASQPPLYYYLGAALTFWIDTSDMAQVRWLNPHVDNGVITLDGNRNLAIHDPAFEPWQGTLLAIHLVRLLSVLLGAVTVYFTFAIAKLAFPERPEIVWGTTAVLAFTPMFLFISGAVNNDNLIIPLATIALWLMIRVVDKDLAQTSWQLAQYWGVIGMIIGLAALTKISGLGLLALAWGTLVMRQWQRSDRSVTLVACGRWLVVATGQWLLLVVVPVLLVAGWWYYRNIVLYGDWKGWTAFIAVLGQRAHPASLAQLWGERRGFMMAYWGLFGGVNVPMWSWIYTLLNGVVVFSVFGFIWYVWQQVRQWYQETTFSPLRLEMLFGALLALVERYFALVVCLLWAGAIVYGLIDWATTTWSSQGRLVFSALPALTLLLLTGLVAPLPRRWATWVAGSLAGFMLLIAVLTPWVWIRPVYSWDGYAPVRLFSPQPTHVNFGETLQLVSFDVMSVAPDETTVRPGDAVDVMLEWEVLAETARDWSTFVHLVDPVLGTPIAQRDMYPQQGLRPTSLLPVGERFMDYYRLTVPETAVAPTTLTLAVGWYDFETGERLSLATGGDVASLAQLMLQAKPGDVPNALSVNFEDALTLVGYELSPRLAVAAETVELTLYWQTERPLTVDYTFFAQVISEDTTRWASHDLSPTVATSAWPTNEVQSLTLSLPLREDTPAAVYPVIVGVYTRTVDGEFDRLQILTQDGRLTDDFVTLTLLRVN